MSQTTPSEASRGKRPSAKFLLVLAGDLGSVVDDAEDGETAGTSWLDKLDIEVGDDLVEALRKIFTITYRSDFTENAEERMLTEIRDLATAALRPFTAALKSLRLKPVGVDPEWKDESAKVFKFVIVPAKALRTKIKVDRGKKARFVDIFETASADGLFVAARKILALTFAEVFTRRERQRVLWEIRRIAADVLVPLNPIIEEMELEPVAMPQRPFDDHDNGDDEEAGKQVPDRPVQVNELP